MSDANLMNDMDDITEGTNDGKKRKKGKGAGMVASGLIKILVLVAAIVAAILFIVGVSFITVKMMDKERDANILTNIRSDLYTPPGNHDYADAITVRGRTSDRVGRTFMVEVRLGYKPGDEKTASELGRRTFQLQDLLRQFFSSQKVENLSPEREDALKAELRNQVNNILSQGSVTDVIFTQFIVDFG